MNTLRKCMSLILCPCLAAPSFPVFASSSARLPDYIKVGLTDAEMGRAIGGNGSIDAEMADYKLGGTTATAVVTNRFQYPCNYEMNLVDINGAVVQTLASGVIDPNKVVIVHGTPPRGGVQNQRIQVRVYHPGLPGMEAVDSSWAVQSIDSDADGIDDADENRYGLNPWDAGDANQDLDGDGLSNAQEINSYYTDPTLADTDGDTISDGAEVLYALNPNSAADAELDPDRDFMTNAEEINTYNTHPTQYSANVAPDADGDGLNDRLEARLGLDPNDALSTVDGGASESMQRTLHVLNRTTFGPNKALLDKVASVGLDAWLTDQLIPIGLDNDPPDPAQVMRDENVAPGYYAERTGAIRPMHSVKQLQTRMAMFWDNHFSTSIQKTRTEAELYEEDQFFVNAFGNFRTLLGISAKGEAMMRYLDLFTSKKAGPNENYAREVMELHTFGDTSLYTSADVSALSKMLTGWGISNTIEPITYSRYNIYNNGVISKNTVYTFNFNNNNHDTTTKTFLGQQYANAGVAEGEAALDVLANHSATANNICTKLATYFVSDTPDQVTINGCVNTFMANASNPRQMGAVLANLLGSDQFNDPDNYRTKFKDTQEYMYSLARILNWSAVAYTQPGMQIDYRGIGGRINEAGQRQFAKDEPVGWEEVGDAWINADVALNRFREANELIYNSTYTNLVQYFDGLGMTNSADIIGHMLQMMLGGKYEPKHVELAYWALHPNNATFALTDTDAETRLKNAVARLAQLPEFNLH